MPTLVTLRTATHGRCLLIEVDTYLGARYRRLLPRLGNDRAIVALQHDILVAAWHMLRRDEPYRDLGADHHERLDPERTRRNAVAQLQRLGYRISLVPAA